MDVLLVYRSYGEFVEAPAQATAKLLPGAEVRYFNGSVELAAIMEDAPGRFERFVETSAAMDAAATGDKPIRYFAVRASGVQYATASVSSRVLRTVQVTKLDGVAVPEQAPAEQEPFALDEPKEDLPDPPEADE